MNIIKDNTETIGDNITYIILKMNKVIFVGLLEKDSYVQGCI